MAKMFSATETVAPLLKHCFRAILDGLSHEVSKSGVFNLNPSVLTVFSGLGTSETRVVDLAKSLAVTKQSAGQMVKELQLMGFLDLQPDPNDRRAKIIVLTEKGQALRKEIRTAKQNIEDRVAQEFSADELQELHDKLTRLKDLVATESTG